METLEQFRRDEKWLARASDAIASYWRERNAHKAASAVGKKSIIKR
jgi:predicted lipoprotein with Yx(FWY)xxD motif